eukprot:TRINITY_DN65465_c0_g1_i1.p1 TRINITY_DN65465_c0_g1~~TRINITY_DN65465_c0_g1_i1.p1  ORF type:complete len:170 (-),score=43.05 TRINITY_DN65465_c0_g1_i1:53-562(-)
MCATSLRYPTLVLMVAAILCAAISLIGINPDAMPWTKAELKGVFPATSKFGLIEAEDCGGPACSTRDYDDDKCKVSGSFIIATTAFGGLASFVVLHSTVHGNRGVWKTVIASVSFLAGPIIWAESCHKHIKDKYSSYDVDFAPGFYLAISAFATSVLALGFQLATRSRL